MDCVITGDLTGRAENFCQAKLSGLFLQLLVHLSDRQIIFGILAGFDVNLRLHGSTIGTGLLHGALLLSIGHRVVFLGSLRIKRSFCCTRSLGFVKHIIQSGLRANH